MNEIEQGINNPTASPQKANNSIETENDSQNCGGSGVKVTGGTPKKRRPRVPKLPIQSRADGRGPAKHLLWVDWRKVKLDGRCQLSKTIKFIKASLTRHVGGQPTIAQSLLIDRIAFKAIRCTLWEAGFWSDDEQGSRDHYLAMSNSVRLDLAQLGMDERQLPEMDLNDYIRKTYGEKNKKDGR